MASEKITAIIDEIKGPVSYTHLDVYKRQAVRHSGAGSGLQQPAGLVHSGLFRVEMFKILHFFKTPVPLNSCYTGAPRQLAGLTVIFTMLRLTAAVSMSSR